MMIKNIGGFTGAKNFRSKSKPKRKALQKPKKIKEISGSTTGDVNGSYSLPYTKKTVKGGGVNAIRKKISRKGKLKT